MYNPNENPSKYTDFKIFNLLSKQTSSWSRSSRSYVTRLIHEPKLKSFARYIQRNIKGKIRRRGNCSSIHVSASNEPSCFHFYASFSQPLCPRACVRVPWTHAPCTTSLIRCVLIKGRSQQETLVNPFLSHGRGFDIGLQEPGWIAAIYSKWLESRACVRVSEKFAAMHSRCTTRMPYIGRESKVYESPDSFLTC